MTKGAKNNPVTGANMEQPTTKSSRHSTRLDSKETLNSDSYSLEKATAIMVKASLISVEDEAPNCATLAEALKYLAVTSRGQSRSQATTEILLALAAYTTHLDLTNTANIIADTVIELLEPMISQEHAQNQNTDHDAMINALQAQQTESSERLMAEITKLSERMQERPIPQDTRPNTVTYASMAANQGTGPPPPSAAYHNDLRSRQIMVEGYNTTNPTSG